MDKFSTRKKWAGQIDDARRIVAIVNESERQLGEKLSAIVMRRIREPKTCAHSKSKLSKQTIAMNQVLVGILSEMGAHFDYDDDLPF